VTTHSVQSAAQALFQDDLEVVGVMMPNGELAQSPTKPTRNTRH
jgi:hypothetical protein